MTTRLTDIERTLLSAYRDGELSAGEHARAEKLLGASSDAQAYLGDLHSLTAYSKSLHPSTLAVGVAGFGSKLTGGAIQMAARTAGRSAFAGSWGIAGLAAIAVATVVVLTLTFTNDRTPAQNVSASATPRAVTAGRTRSLVVDSTNIMVPAITHAELIDFAVSGRLPIDSSRERYVTVHQQSGAMAIKMDSASTSRSPSFPNVNLRATRGLASLERSIRTCLLQAEGDGIAVRMDLPSLRLGVIEALQAATDELPEDVRRTMNASRQELDREHQRLSGELRQSRLDSRRDRGNGGVRYLVVAGTDLPMSVDRGADVTWTFTPNDRRVQTCEVSASELGSLEALVDVQRSSATRPPDQRVRTVSAPAAARPFSRRVHVLARGPSARPTTVSDASADSTISFEQIQILQNRGQTLDGVYNATEHWIERAEQILVRSDEIRRRIQLLRSEQQVQPDSSGAHTPEHDDVMAPPEH